MALGGIVKSRLFRVIKTNLNFGMQKKPNFKGILQARLINLKEELKNKKQFIFADSVQGSLDLVAKM